MQNFVGQTTHDFQEQIYFICPRPQDVPSLMRGWMVPEERVSSGDLDAVLAAAVSAFAFIFVHPFEDGNGRIHRRHLYDRALEAFSRPLLPDVEWKWAEDRSIEVLNSIF